MCTLEHNEQKPSEARPSASVRNVSTSRTFPMNRMKSPTVLMAATLRAFSTRIRKESRADVQKLVLLMAVAVYAFCGGSERRFAARRFSHRRQLPV